MPFGLSPGRLIATAAVAAGLLLLIFPPAGLEGDAAKAAAVAVAAIGLWATGAIPEALTALAFFLAAMLIGVAPADVVFSGFAAAAIWLIFGGLVVGAGIRRTGLGKRLANAIGAVFPSTYLGMLVGLVAVGVLLSFLLPSSMGRMVLLIPIAVSIAEACGFERGSNGHTGIVLAAGCGAFLPAFSIMTANVPNIVLIGASEAVWGISPIYGEYLLLHFPLLGLGKALLLPFVIYFAFPDRMERQAEEPEAAGPMSRDEKRLAAILVLALAFWATDFLHHISPAWIGLAAAVVCLTPRISIVPAESFAKEVDLSPVFYVAGIIGLGAVISHSGLGDSLARALLGVADLRPGADAQNFALVVGATSLLSLAVTLPPVPIIMTPLAGGIAEATGLSIEAALMMQVIGFSTMILPFQSPPLVVGLHMAGVPVVRATRIVLTMAALTVLVLLPLDFLWWRLLGWFG
ncbi:MAG: anion permease [Minwuiales bacterium]|nr:anion permease [Minwuiales bacterium]